MVCLGNICRSPLAEGILQKQANEAGLKWTTDSAGTNKYHIGEPPHELSQKVALMHGIDISDQRARRFVPSDLHTFDKIYVLAADVWKDVKRIAGTAYIDEKIDLLLNELYPGMNKDVPDPWSGPFEGYLEAYDLIERACEKVVERYR